MSAASRPGSAGGRGDAASTAPWRARLLLGMLAAALLGVLALIVALALGWNNPRPARPPDWEAPGLPQTLTAGAGARAGALLERTGDTLTLEGQATPLGGSHYNAYGLLYRAQDADHGYVAALGADGYYAVLRLDGGQETALVDWQQFPHVRRGQQTNRLRVACSGPTCQVFINDEIAATVTDAMWTEGWVGLWARSFDEGPISVEFSSLRVWAGSPDEQAARP